MILSRESHFSSNQKGGQGSVTCSPKRLPKGGQRWNNTSEIGGVING